MGRLATTLGEHVKALRAQQGLSQAQLAEAAHVSEEWVRRIERGAGSPSLDTVEVLASALGVLPGDLFERTEEPAHVAALAMSLRTLSEAEIAWLHGALRLIADRPRR